MVATLGGRTVNTWWWIVLILQWAVVVAAYSVLDVFVDLVFVLEIGWLVAHHRATDNDFDDHKCDSSCSLSVDPAASCSIAEANIRMYVHKWHGEWRQVHILPLLLLLIVIVQTPAAWHGGSGEMSEWLEPRAVAEQHWGIRWRIFSDWWRVIYSHLFESYVKYSLGGPSLYFYMHCSVCVCREDKITLKTKWKSGFK